MSTFSKIDVTELPNDYVVRKFYEYGYNVVYNKGNNTYNCCCPICMEGKSFGKKKRCFYVVENNNIYCHNCKTSLIPYNWIRKVGELTYEDIVSEIENGEYSIENLDKKAKEEEKIVKYFSSTPQNLLGLPDDCIDLTNDIELEHYKSNSIVKKALKYIKARKLNDAINKPSKLYLSLGDYSHKNRIIFPFFENKNLIPFYQSRAFGGNISGHKENIRYLSKTGYEKSVFNYDKISNDIDDIFVFEGPIDACFCRNGVAVAGITEGGGVDLTPLQRKQLSYYNLTHRIVWMLDSQYLDSTSYNKTEKLLKAGECVFIWPEREGRLYKDFNEWCIAEDMNEVPIDIIRKNIRCSYSDMLMIKFKKDWLNNNQSLEEDFYGDFSPNFT